MELMISGLALFVGLVALWLSGHTAKKFDGAAEEVIRIYVNKLRTEIDKNATDVKVVETHLKKLQQAVEKLKEMQVSETSRLRTDIEDLDRNIRTSS